MNIISSESGCFASQFYSKGIGMLRLNLEKDGCVTISTVVHELLHSLGFMHEQQRFDRDDYITVNWKKFKVRNKTAKSF